MPVSMSNLSDDKARFLRDLITGFLISAAFISFAELFLSHLPDFFGVVLYMVTFGMILYVHFVVPGLLIVFGLFTVRMGYMAGPFLAVLAASFTQQAITTNQISRTQGDVEKLLSQPLSKPTQRHKLVAIEGRNSCWDICRSILATRSLTVATPTPRQEGWTLHEAIEGDECWHRRYKGSNFSQIIPYLLLGRANTCLESRQTAEIDTALVLTVHRQTRPDYIPATFRGTVLEASELVSGERRRLGLWLGGTITTRSDFVSLGNRQKRFKPSISKEEFISQFLELGSTSPNPLPPDDPVTVLNSAERLFETVNPGSEVPHHFARVAVACCRNRPDLLKPVYDRLLQSDDILRATAALKIIGSLGEDSDVVISRAHLAELILRVTENPALRHLAEVLYPHMRRVSEAFPADTRNVAKKHLVSATGMHRSQRGLLFSLLIRGGQEERTETMNTVFSLDDRLFTETICAMGPYGKIHWRGVGPKGWTQHELVRILERALRMPVSTSWKCLYAFGDRVKVGNHLKEQMAQKVEQRIADMERTESWDQDEIGNLKRILEKTPRIEH